MRRRPGRTDDRRQARLPLAPASPDGGSRHVLHHGPLAAAGRARRSRSGPGGVPHSSSRPKPSASASAVSAQCSPGSSTTTRRDRSTPSSAAASRPSPSKPSAAHRVPVEAAVAARARSRAVPPPVTETTAPGRRPRSGRRSCRTGTSGPGRDSWSWDASAASVVVQRRRRRSGRAGRTSAGVDEMGDGVEQLLGTLLSADTVERRALLSRPTSSSAAAPLLLALVSVTTHRLSAAPRPGYGHRPETGPARVQNERGSLAVERDVRRLDPRAREPRCALVQASGRRTHSIR